MPNKEPLNNLTNERVKNLAKFSNQFDLVNSAIGLAREIIKGRQPDVETDNQNVAVQALMELADQENK